MVDNMTGRHDNSVTQFKVYEDYLDSRITTVDLFYLEVSQTITNISCQPYIQASNVTADEGFLFLYR